MATLNQRIAALERVKNPPILSDKEAAAMCRAMTDEQLLEIIREGVRELEAKASLTAYQQSKLDSFRFALLPGRERQQWFDDGRAEWSGKGMDSVVILRPR